jgi:hypothetical protein
VELPLGLRLPEGGALSQEVRPEDKMATDSQNGDIITPLFLYFFFNNDEGKG